MRMYGQSKLANILFTVELAKRLKDKSVYCNSLHPGSAATHNTHNTLHTTLATQLINRCHRHWVKQEFIGLVWLVRLCGWRGRLDICQESLEWVPHFSLRTLSLSHPHSINLIFIKVSTAPAIEEETGRFWVPTAKLSTASAFGQNEESASKLWEFRYL